MTPTKEQWAELVVPLTKKQIAQYTTYNYTNAEWHAVRLEMIDTPVEARYYVLREWLRRRGNSEAARVQVANYVNALKRGGLL